MSVLPNLTKLKLPKVKFQLSIPNYQSPKVITCWSVLLLLLLGNFSFLSATNRTMDSLQANQEAIATLKTTSGGVLTDNKLAPHLTHREKVKLLNQKEPDNLE